MRLSINGIVKNKTDLIKKSNNFTMALLLIETLGRYPQPVKFQFVNDRADLLQHINIDDEVLIHFDIRGSYYGEKNKVINNLNGWKIEKVTQSESTTAGTSDDDSF